MSEPRLFLVRVWRHLNQFRAAVRGVDQDEPRLFEEPAQLGEFLHAASADAGPLPSEHEDAPAVSKSGSSQQTLDKPLLD